MKTNAMRSSNPPGRGALESKLPRVCPVKLNPRSGSGYQEGLLTPQLTGRIAGKATKGDQMNFRRQVVALNRQRMSQFMHQNRDKAREHKHRHFNEARGVADPQATTDERQCQPKPGVRRQGC